MSKKIQSIFATFGLLSLAYLILFESWQWILASLVYYKLVVGLFGNQIAQHRYFSHRSFQTTNSKSWFLYFVSLTTGLDPSWYAIAHRHHHIWSDTDNDVHSPLNGWRDIMSPLIGQHRIIKDVKVARVFTSQQNKINKYWYLLFVAYLLILASVDVNYAIYLALAGVGWNYIHMILFRVWLMHVKLPGSYKNFDLADASYNNKFIQVLDIGEGLHNNHHQYPNRYDQAVNSNEFDPAGWVVNKLFILK